MDRIARKSTTSEGLRSRRFGYATDNWTSVAAKSPNDNKTGVLSWIHEKLVRTR